MAGPLISVPQHKVIITFKNTNECELKMNMTVYKFALDVLTGICRRTVCSPSIPLIRPQHAHPFKHTHRHAFTYAHTLV